ncbi:HAD family hydrolase [candidate division KSB1 bacterium]
MLIKNIIFDFGGVIINIDHKRTEDAFKNLGIIDFESMYSKVAQTQLFDLLETGRISQGIFVQEIQKLLPVSEEKIINAWNSIIMDLPEHRIRLLEETRKHYHTFLLSNSNKIHYDLYVADLKSNFGYEDFTGLFEKVYFSFQVGMRKPDAEIFELVIDENQLDPKETLFIDDSFQHIDGAKKCGLQTYFLKQEEDITDLFEKGILK